MVMKRLPLGAFWGALWLLLLFSCNRLPPTLPDLPATEVISLRNKWAVISLAYLPLYEEGNLNTAVQWVARRMEVFEVMAQSLETEFLYGKEEYWYQLRHDRTEGWAFGAGLYAFPSEREAYNAAARLESGEGF